MNKTYNVATNLLGTEIIWYEENGLIISFPNDPANSDYQSYLNRDNPDWNNQPTL